MQEALSETRTETSRTRAWKLFMFLPRILFFRQGRGGFIPKNKLHKPFAMFAEGHLDHLVAARANNCHSSQSRSVASTYRQVDNVEKRAERAQALVELGELSSARQALGGATCAPGDDTTKAVLTNPAKRPPELRVPFPEELIRHRHATQFSLDQDRFWKCVRKRRKGAAGGPSGMATEHLRVVLNIARDNEMLWQMTEDFVRAKVPVDVLEGIHLCRMTALRKPTGGVRGIVVGDTFRKAVSRFVAQQIAASVERATAPFQHALGH